MSTFEVKVRKIDNIEPHSNADRLELVSIGGYRAVVQKGIHGVEDLIVYLPTDSVIPDGVAVDLGIKDYLVGKQKNRIKAVRLRGEISQGIVLPLQKVVDYLGWKDEVIPDVTDFAGELEIDKYEEPIPVQMQGKARPWPSYLNKYDIENVNRPEALHLLEGKEVVATEKLHGTNMAVSIACVNEVWEQHVCSRNFSLEEAEGNLYWIAARKYELLPKIESMISAPFLREMLNIDEIQEVTLRGEAVGVQDLKYGFNGGDPGFFVFDICVNGSYIPFVNVVSICSQYNIPVVPLVYADQYDYGVLKELSQASSQLGGGVREGIVVKPSTYDEYVHGFGRVIVKFINEDYLTRKGGSEHH